MTHDDMILDDVYKDNIAITHVRAIGKGQIKELSFETYASLNEAFDDYIALQLDHTQGERKALHHTGVSEEDHDGHKVYCGFKHEFSEETRLYASVCYG